MGLRPLLRRRRKHSHIPPNPSETSPTTPPSPAPLPGPSHSPTASHSHLPPRPFPPSERWVEPLRTASIQPQPAQIHPMSTASITPPASTASESTRSSVFSHYSFRRIFPSKTARKRALRKQIYADPQIPDADTFDSVLQSDADLSDASASTFCASKDVTRLSTDDMKNSTPGELPDVGELMAMGKDVPAGKRVNDEYVSFIVPKGWTACRKEGCVYFFCGMSVGYVRTVHGKDAARALLETDRLELVDHVNALSSPVWEGRIGECMKVQFSSQLGAGSGLAVFGQDVHTGACVMAMCGPWSESNFIWQSLQQLRSSVRLIKVYSESEVAIPIGDTNKDKSEHYEALPQATKGQPSDAACCVQ